MSKNYLVERLGIIENREVVALGRIDLADHDNRDDNSVNSHGFTENDGNEVLALDPGHLYR